MSPNGKRQAKITFAAENHEDSLELRKLYDEFVGGQNNYVSPYDDESPKFIEAGEFGKASKLVKLTLIIGKPRDRTPLTPAELNRGIRSYAKRIGVGSEATPN